MKKVKKFMQSYGLLILIELLIVVMMVGSAIVVYKQTYKLEYEKTVKMFEETSDRMYSDVRIGYEEGSDMQVSDFLMELQYNSIFDTHRTHGGKYNGYGVSWEICDKNNQTLEESAYNDLMLLWCEPEEKSYGTVLSPKKAYLVEKYFTEEEMEGAWKLISSQKDELSGMIRNVTGYYDENNEFVPVEIVLWDHDFSEEYSLKSKENANKEGVEYITRNGDVLWYDIAETEGYFKITNLKKTKPSVNKAIEEFKNGEKHSSLLERGYYCTTITKYWYGVSKEDMISEVAQNEPAYVKIRMCADLNYITWNNTIFKTYLIVEVILCLLIGIGIIYIVLKFEQRRKYLDSMKYTFINAMAHEMKTPSAVIVNSVECIKDGVKPEKQSKYLDKVKKEGLHMNRLLLDMLTYTKLTDEDKKLIKEEIDVKELLEEVVQHYTDEVEKKEIKVQWYVSSQKTIMADRTLMEMVFDNYLSNAVKYCKEPGIIKITIDEKKVCVYNSGDRIYPTKLQAIWEPLYVTDKARRDREGSSGMGLAISAKIMDMHGMKYGARNTGDGVEFYIKLA